MDTLHTLTHRVSSGALVAPAPSDDALAQILAAATRAPDHGLLRPWRFFVIRDDARNALGESDGRALAGTRSGYRSGADRSRAQEAAARADDPGRGGKGRSANKIPVIEQVLSAGAARRT
jgi:nitroreductase